MPEPKTVVGSRVYVIRVEDGDRVKIGRAKNVNTRLSSLRSSSPFPLEKLSVVPGAICVEHYLHARFDDLRLHGEWFTFDPVMEQIQVDQPLPAPEGEPVKLKLEWGRTATLDFMHRAAHIEQQVCLGRDTPDKIAFHVNRELADVEYDLKQMVEVGYFGMASANDCRGFTGEIVPLAA